MEEIDKYVNEPCGDDSVTGLYRVSGSSGDGVGCSGGRDSVPDSC